MALQARSNTTAQGRTAIVITRPTVFRGRPVDVGAEFDDATSEELAVMIGCGKARRRPLPQEIRQPQRETAEAVPVVEVPEARVAAPTHSLKKVRAK